MPWCRLGRYILKTQDQSRERKTKHKHTIRKRLKMKWEQKVRKNNEKGGKKYNLIESAFQPSTNYNPQNIFLCCCTSLHNEFKIINNRFDFLSYLL